MNGKFTLQVGVVMPGSFLDRHTGYPDRSSLVSPSKCRVTIAACFEIPCHSTITNHSDIDVISLAMLAAPKK
jgi:hypothetical protein